MKANYCCKQNCLHDVKTAWELLAVIGIEACAMRTVMVSLGSAVPKILAWYTAVSLDTTFIPPIFIEHFLSFRLPSERALKSVPPGRAEPLQGPRTVNKKTAVLKRGSAGPNEIQTWERSSLPPVSSAGIYPHPEVCSAIKHSPAFLKFSCFSYLLFISFVYVNFSLFSPQILSLERQTRSSVP
jgi:hypothetical protein